MLYNLDFYKVCLFVGNGLVPCGFLFYYIFRDRRATIILIFTACLSVFVNAILKMIWKTPLDPVVFKKDWYAFPSGHMQATTLLCMAICLIVYKSSYRKKYFSLSVLVSYLMLYLYGQAMVHFHFHTWIDVGGGYIAGLLMVALFGWAWQYFQSDYYKLGILFFLIACGTLLFLPKAAHGYRWLYPLLGDIAGATLGVFLLEKMTGIMDIKPQTRRAHISCFLLWVPYFSEFLYPTQSSSDWP